MLKTIFLTFMLATIFIIATTYIYLGGYKDADFQVTNRPSFYLVYKDILGSYEQTSFAIAEIEEKLKSENIICERTFGYFLDSPDKIVESDLRSKVGCLFSNSQSTSLKQTKLSPAKSVVRAVFEGSPALGPMKVYDKAHNWLSGKSAFPSLEIYSYNTDNKIITTYYFQVTTKGTE